MCADDVGTIHKKGQRPPSVNRAPQEADDADPDRRHPFDELALHHEPPGQPSPDDHRHTEEYEGGCAGADLLGLRRYVREHCEWIRRRDRCRQVSKPATSDALLPDHRVEGDQDDEAEEDSRRENEGFLPIRGSAARRVLEELSISMKLAHYRSGASGASLNEWVDVSREDMAEERDPHSYEDNADNSSEANDPRLLLPPLLPPRELLVRRSGPSLRTRQILGCKLLACCCNGRWRPRRIDDE